MVASQIEVSAKDVSKTAASNQKNYNPWRMHKLSKFPHKRTLIK